MTPNIDESGRRLRFAAGVLSLIVAVVLVVIAVVSDGAPWWLWLLGVLAAGLGAFAIYEARHRWCALRALSGKARP